MALKKLSAMCSVCPKANACDRKRMECLGMLEMPNIAASVAEPVLADLAAPLAVKHDYRDIKVSENVTVTIDVEDLKRALVKSQFPGFLNNAGM